MSTVQELCLFWIIVAIQIVGIASVVAARLAERSYLRGVCQRSFFFCLLAVGLATVVAIQLDGISWLSCAATLGVMSVGATLDFESSGAVEGV